VKAQRVLVLGCVCAIALAALPFARRANAQQDQSLAQKAREVRRQEKAAPKATKVWTNENLPTSAPLSVVGKTAPAGASAPAEPAQASKGTGKPQSAAELRSRLADLQAQLKDAKEKLHSVRVDLNIAQREYKLDSDQFYSSPDYNSNRQGKAKLDADQSRIRDKQSLVDEEQQKVDELQKKIAAVEDKLKAAQPQSAAKSEGAA